MHAWRGVLRDLEHGPANVRDNLITDFRENARQRCPGVRHREKLLVVGITKSPEVTNLCAVGVLNLDQLVLFNPDGDAASRGDTVGFIKGRYAVRRDCAFQ